jgi:hypothetical protein
MNPTFLQPRTEKELNDLSLDLIHFLERCRKSHFRKLWEKHISFQANRGADGYFVGVCLRVLFSFLRTHEHKLNGVPGEWSVCDNGSRYIDLLINDKVVRYTFYSRKYNPDFQAFEIKEKCYYAFTIETDVENPTESDKQKSE